MRIGPLHSEAVLAYSAAAIGAGGVVRRALIGFAAIGLAVPAGAGFDAPLKSEIVATGPKSARHCLTFPTFLLKWEADTTGGSPLIVIVPGKGPWPCAEMIAGQKHLQHWEMARVKGPYIVLSYAAQKDYAAEFKVFDTKAWRYVAEAALFNDFTSVRLDGHDLVLQYRRSINRECSLYYGAGTACWSEIKALTGLTNAQMPDCRTAYEIAKKKLNVADITGYPATVTFNAETRVADGKVIAEALPGPITCEP